MTEQAERQSALLSRARQHFAQRRLGEAREDFEAALSLGPVTAPDYNDYGRLLNNLREFDGARQAFASAVAMDGDFADAHNNLGHVLRALNKASEAADCFRRAVAIKPDYTRAWQNLGTVLALTGDYAAAIEALEKALTLSPADADAHLNIAGLYRVTDATGDAEKHLRQAIELAPSLIDAKIQLASLLESRGELSESADCYRAALDLDGVNPEALAGLADVMDKNGEYEQGLDLLVPGLAQHPHDPRMAVARARLLRRTGKGEEALALLAATRTASPRETERLPRYFFTLGELYDEQGEYDAAFASFRQANELKDETFNPADVIDAIDALIAVFTPAFMAAAPSSGNASERPVFIVGMPRSGTSLVEQMLASHPAVYGGGELRLIVDMVKGLGTAPVPEGFYPECVPALDSAGLANLAASYLDALSGMHPDALRVTDKMPHNFLHLGLIQMLLPNAKVIHCVRHPLDTILSCYFQDFASTAMAFSNNIEHLAIYYQQYQRLMRHWRGVLPNGFMDVQYESLVDDPKTVSASMLDFIGLDWDESVLDFHKSRRLVKTASHAQVRQPIYRRSLARHENYAQHLAQLRGILDPPPDPADL